MECWIIACKNSLERTKVSLDMYFSLKNFTPEFFTNRDPKSRWFQNVTKIAYSFPMPILTPEFNRVCVCGFFDTDFSKLELVDLCRVAGMFSDLTRGEDYHVAYIYVLDLANVSIGITNKLSLTTLKKWEVITSNCFNLRIRSIHIVNAPPYINMLMGIAKAVLRPKIFKRIHVHENGIESLSDHIPKKSLPQEYGGDGGSVAEIWNSWKKYVESRREWFLQQDKLKSVESKRPGKAMNHGNIFGFEGSFRQLGFD
ncbi:retinol-binding protein pinta-like isoform X2 [Periplaneta americana]